MLHRLPQEELDLSIDAAQVGGGPGFQLLPKSRIDAKKKWLALRHGRFDPKVSNFKSLET